MCDCQFCKFDPHTETLPFPVRFKTRRNVCFTAWIVAEDKVQTKWSLGGKVHEYATLQDLVLAANEHLGLDIERDYMKCILDTVHRPSLPEEKRKRFFTSAAGMASRGADPDFGPCVCGALLPRTKVTLLPESGEKTPPKRGKKRARVQMVTDRNVSPDHPNYESIQEMVSDPSERWDAEFLMQLLELGGHPPLVSHAETQAVYQGNVAALLCRFEKPDGSPTNQVLLPKHFVRFLYGLA